MLTIPSTSSFPQNILFSEGLIVGVSHEPMHGDHALSTPIYLPPATIRRTVCVTWLLCDHVTALPWPHLDSAIPKPHSEAATQKKVCYFLMVSNIDHFRMFYVSDQPAWEVTPSTLPEDMPTCHTLHTSWNWCCMKFWKRRLQDPFPFLVWVPVLVNYIAVCDTVASVYAQMLFFLG